MKRALKHIRIEGFRSLRNVELKPGPVTVMIGPNGAGKSNVLSFLKMVSLMKTGSLRRFVGEEGGASSQLFYGPKVTKEMAFWLEFGQEDFSNSYHARLGYAAGDSLIFLDEQVGRRGPQEGEFQTFSLGAGHKESSLAELLDEDRHTERAVSWWLNRMSFYHFHDTSPRSELRTNSRAEDSRSLRSDGSNLAAYLASLRWSSEPAEQKAWRRINLWVQKVAPFIKEVQPNATNGRGEGPPEPGQWVRLDWLDERDEIFACDRLSDGTLRAIALITALAQPSASLPAFISIDEPELGLHPAALGLLAGLIKSASSRCQILLATQSPALLDHFSAEDVVVTERGAGATELRRLDPVDLSGWLEEYTLSELYDKNVLGGRP